MRMIYGLVCICQWASEAHSFRKIFSVCKLRIIFCCCFMSCGDAIGPFYLVILDFCKCAWKNQRPDSECNVEISKL